MNRLQLGRSEASPALDLAEVGLLEELERAGYVQSFADGGGATEELRRKQRELADLMARRAESGKTSEDFRAILARRRSEILELAERTARVENSVEVRGRRYALTYRGRTLLSNLLTRLPRAEGMEVSALERELEVLRRTLDARAAKAAELFARLKPGPQEVPEADLRAVAVGLSARAESVGDLDGALRRTINTLLDGGVPPERVGTIAECIVVARGAVDSSGAAEAARELSDLRTRISVTFGPDAAPDRLSAASLLFPLDEARRQAVLADAASLRQQVLAETGTGPASLAPLFLVAAADVLRTPGGATRFARMCEELVGRGCPRSEAELAAAILVTSKRDPVYVIRYFEVARDYLSRFSSAGMAVPAAMLSILEVSVEESLDDLRLAAASVAAKGLSPGGIENLSLGLKLLVQTAMLVGAPEGSRQALQVGPDDAATLAAFGLSGLALVLPAALTVLAAFHEVTVHRYATSEEAYHPVHTHFIYG
jgi:hypothetical protein